jgi:DNA-binding response OmpR family regulator
VDRLESGADGYLVTPISPLVLRAQIRALLRRGTLVNRDEIAERQVLRLGSLTVDLLAKQASVGARSVEFSKREFALLRVLANHPHTPLSKEELLQMAWGDRRDITLNAVEVYIGYLRKRLRAVGASQCIETCRGQGYQLNAPMLSDDNRTSLPNGDTA